MHDENAEAPSGRVREHNHARTYPLNIDIGGPGARWRGAWRDLVGRSVARS
jgi:hypothetical protein